MLKKILLIVLAVAMVFVLIIILFIGYLFFVWATDIRKDPYKYTEEEHTENIEEN